MRKHQTLLIAGILLLASTAAAQAQAVYEAFGNAVMAREGGAGEKAGEIVLFLRTGTHDSGVVTVRFSAPLAEETEAVISDPTNASIDTDVDEGTVTVTMPASLANTLTITNVRLDLREATAPVTATFSGDEKAFVSGVVTVISAISEALEVKSTSTGQILTRGGVGSATILIEEAFATAFTAESEVMLTVVGVPDEAVLTVSHVQPGDGETAADVTDVANTVTLNSTEIVASGAATATDLEMPGDGDKLNITVGFSAGGPNEGATESLHLMFDLAAEDDVMLPLDEGEVTVWVTMAPTEKPATVDKDTEYFTVNYIPANGVLALTIEPASCTLLFPYAVSAGMWDTGIAVANPSAFTDTPLSGTLMFSLFPNDAPMAPYATHGGSPGTGLAADGSLPAGNTYSVLLSEVLDDAGMPGDFTGHLYVRTNFTGCRGVGWLTDFATVNQAYLPYFGDNLDEASVPGNNTNPDSD